MTKCSTVLVTASLAALLALFAAPLIAHADIFQWEYINPANPAQGKQQSTMLAPDGAGAYAAAGADLFGRDLTMAYLIGANLIGANADVANFTNAELSQANLTGASFAPYGNEYGIGYADLTGANLSDAVVLATQFTSTNLTMSQLASTASYQARNLTGIGLQGVNLATANFASQNLTYATFNGAILTGANFNHINAAGIVLVSADLANASFDHANLAYADFDGAILQNADFSGAFLAGAHMGHTSLAGVNFSAAVVHNADLRASGITAAQLYSTASYQAHFLWGIKLIGNNLSGVNLVRQNLTSADLRANLADANLSQANLTGADLRANLPGANLSQANLAYANFSGFQACDDYGCQISPGANLEGANLSGADARGANFQFAWFSGANTANLIQSDGHIAGLDLTSDASLVVRDYDGNPAASPPTGPLPIVVDQHLAMDATGALRLVFDADPWDSTISFAPGIPVARGGTLELTFSPGVDVATQSGRTIDLFDWTGVTPTGSFTVSSPYTWNLTNLYTTGEVTLTAVPSLPGDFNHDGTVDAADYVVWRKNPAGIYTQDDFNLWRANFGQPSGSGSVAAANATVPEPTSALLLLMGVLTMCTRCGANAS